MIGSGGAVKFSLFIGLRLAGQAAPLLKLFMKAILILILMFVSGCILQKPRPEYSSEYIIEQFWRADSIRHAEITDSLKRVNTPQKNYPH